MTALSPGCARTPRSARSRPDRPDLSGEAGRRANPEGVRVNELGLLTAGQVRNPAPPEGDWRQRAACRDRDDIGPDAWFDSPKSQLTALAVAVCRSCPVRVECLTFAMDTLPASHLDGWGIFGGLSAGERYRARRMGLSPADAIALADWNRR